MSTTFTNFNELQTHIQTQKKGFLTINQTNVTAYAGMVLDMTIIFEVEKEKYDLDLQWISFGLDLFGENLLENYLYRFENLELLVNYLDKKYKIKVMDIPTNYKFDDSKFPNPIKNEAEKPIFEAAWERFQQDFKKGIFLDVELELVYSTDNF
jgi:hypothetical protein